MALLYLLFIVVGIAAGAFGGLLGLGGGIILVPALLYLPSLFSGAPALSPQMAVGTSLLLIIITSFASIMSYRKGNLIDYQSGWLFFIGSAPGAVVGAYVVRFFDRSSFNVYYGIFMAFMFLVLTFRKKLRQQNIRWKVTKTYTDENGEVYTYGYSSLLAIILSFLVGIISSMFGIGGGALIVPFLLVLFRFPPHMATATSMFVIFLSSIVGSTTHIMYGHVVWALVLTTAPGAWIGGKLGAAISRRLSGSRIELILRAVLLLIAIRMVIQEL
jgi:uncharacterized protein